MEQNKTSSTPEKQAELKIEGEQYEQIIIPVLEEKKLELEIAKLKLERFKAWLTAGAVVVPLLSGMLTILLTSYNARWQKEIDDRNAIPRLQERLIAPRIELIKLLTEKPEQRQEILKIWKQTFPNDEGLIWKISSEEK